MWSRRLTSAPPPYLASLIRHPRAFLLRIAMNVVRDESRRRKKRGTSETFTEAADPGEAAGQMEALMLKQAVSTMPALYREIFVLSRFAGMSYPEIAAARRLWAAPRTRPAEPCPAPRHLQHHPARRAWHNPRLDRAQRKTRLQTQARHRFIPLVYPGQNRGETRVARARTDRPEGNRPTCTSLEH